MAFGNKGDVTRFKCNIRAKFFTNFPAKRFNPWRLALGFVDPAARKIDIAIRRGQCQ
jgi:hypothetical protein